MKVVFEKGSFRLLGPRSSALLGWISASTCWPPHCTPASGARRSRSWTWPTRPHSSAKDPVNMAGFMMENLEAGLVKQFGLE